jgi:hypothetical protein
MSTVRKLGAAVTVVLALALAACTTSAVQPTKGVVTGIADACTGHPIAKGSILDVRVQLLSGTTLVASESVRSGTRYRFTVVRGRYGLTGWWRPKDVTVRAGRIVRVNLPDYCM